MALFFYRKWLFFLEGNPSGSGLERNGTIKSLLEAAALLARSRSLTSLPSILSRSAASSSYTLLLTAPAQRILSPIGGLLPSRLNPNPQIPDADPAHLRSPSRMERMQWLGILDLAHTLSQSAAASGSGRWRWKPVEPGSVDAARVKPAPPPPSRRSLRYGPNRLLCGGGCVS